jgi:hypothetical protein
MVSGSNEHAMKSRITPRQAEGLIAGSQARPSAASLDHRLLGWQHFGLMRDLAPLSITPSAIRDRRASVGK